jgi:hypothetical protein
MATRSSGTSRFRWALERLEHPLVAGMGRSPGPPRGPFAAPRPVT